MSTEPLTRNPRRRPDRAALVIAALLLVLAGVIAWDASRLGGAAQYARIGPQTIPYVIAHCLAALGIWTVVEAVRGDFPKREPQEALPVLWIVGGLLIQLLTIRWIGFSLATGMLFALVARGFGERRFWLSLPLGIILSLVVWFIFARGLSLTLPAGPLENALLRLVTPAGVA
ncbi:MAG TPA: tripartite tricarboxylate transporter TctB family protein [Devosia sp.]|nr:tripartite tricarboxylate transporter TctB family protein [Devosia sp.]